MTTNEVYRLSWQTVGITNLGKYSNPDPMYYSNTTQTVPNSLIPDDDWYQVERMTDDPWDQYYTLKKWEKSDYGFVRGVLLEKRVGEPQWRVVAGKEDHE